MNKTTKKLIVFTSVAVLLIVFLIPIPPIDFGRSVATPLAGPLEQAPQTTKFYALPSDGSISAYPSSLTKKAGDSDCTTGAWGVARQLPTGVPNATSVGNDFVRSGCSLAGTVKLTRGFLTFDTTSLPDNALITSARLGLYVNSVTNNRNDGNDFVAVVKGNQSLTNTTSNFLGANDFLLTGSSVNNPPEGSARQDLSSVTPGAFLYLPFNANGLAWIAKNNLTKVALREGHDILNLWPNYAPRESNGLSVMMSEQAGLTQDPVLEVTYVVPPSNPRLASARPNIVMVITDDQRWDTMDYMPKVNTLLGPESVKFSNSFVTTPICCPSRISTLTGQYGHNSGVPDAVSLLNLDEATTLPNWLQAIGYRTGLYGKYTENYNLLSAPQVPTGWSEWHALEQQLYYNYRLVDNGVFTQYGNSPEDYSTTVIFDKAKDFIRSTPSDKQFFLYVTPFGPHSPAATLPQDVGTFGSFPNQRPPSYNEADVSDKPRWVRGLSLFNEQDMAQSDAFHRSQLEALQSVDRGVGQLVDELKATNRWGNTIFIFTSDNGLSWGEHRWLDTKRCVYDECVRVPLWIRIPGAVGRTDDRLVANIDLAPTIATRVGATMTRPVDGLNLFPSLASGNIPWRDGLVLEVQNPFQFSSGINFQAVRTPAYLYASYGNGEKELYDLAVDPYQMTNVVNDLDYAPVVSDLQTKLEQLR